MQQVNKIMEKNVEVLRPDSTIREAANKMKELNIGALPVTDGERVLGMVTDRDIVTRALALGQNPEQTKIREIMTKQIVYCLEDESLLDAVERMHDRGVGRLVVLTPDHRLRGILSLGDIVKRLGERRLAALVRDRVSQFEAEWPMRMRRRGIFMGLGTVLSLSTLIAGVGYLRRQPELRSRIRTRIGLEGKERIGEREAA